MAVTYKPDGTAYNPDGSLRPDLTRPKPPKGQSYNPQGVLQDSSGNDVGVVQSNTGSSNTGAPGTNPGQVGNAYYPEYLGGMFPQYTPINFNPIGVPDYTMFDPQRYAQDMAILNTGNFLVNQEIAQSLGLRQLQTELQGLQQFVPGSAALKREQVMVDNAFNQSQRTQQVDAALPGMRGALQAQTGRANRYAEGRLLTGMEDLNLEYGIRSEAADATRARGFGDDSMMGRKTSDLLSASRRLEIAGMGENLLAQNVQTRSALELAPTSYSDAGQQVRVMPEVGAGRAAQAYGTELNRLTILDPATALNADINQAQFDTNLNLDVAKTNQVLGIDVDKFNASNALGVALSKFNYDQGFAGAVAGANQANANQIREDRIREQFTQVFNENRRQTQQSNNISSSIQALGAIAGFFTSFNQASSGGGNNTGTRETGGVQGTRQTTAPGSTTTASPNINAERPGTAGGITGGGQIGTSTAGGGGGNSITTAANQVPSGYTPIASSANGGVVSIPNAQYYSTSDGYNLRTDYTKLYRDYGLIQ